MNEQFKNKSAGEFLNTDTGKNKSNLIEVPSISLPKGGGAIRGIEEKFQVNAVSGTSSFSIPIPFSPSRGGYTPGLGLSYNSGSGNSSFGLGWALGIASITRKTDKKLPQYKDNSDTFILSGSEDMIPLLEKQGDGSWKKYEKLVTKNGIKFKIKRYRPRIEGSFVRIEKIENTTNGEVYWKTISTDNTHSYYGLTKESRLYDPKDESRVFEWLLCQSHDDKGSICIYEYKKEDFDGINKLSDKNKINNCTQIYLKQVCYGNKTPYYLGSQIPDENDFMFRTVFDYGEHDTEVNIPKDIHIAKNSWTCRKDPFSNFRPGFEIRTYRRCHRILMFHCFDAEELPHSPYLTKSLEVFYNHDLKLLGNNSSVNGFSFLVKARQNGHLWDAVNNCYKTKFLPEIEINYQNHAWNTEIKSVSNKNIKNAPSGLADKSYLWIDLYSEGISGILTEKAGGWFYKSNLGNGAFSNAKSIVSKPSFSGLNSGKIAIQELEGNGIKYLVALENEPKGFFKLTEEEDWEPMKNFDNLPNVNFFDPNTRPIDLNGDGLTDLLFTEEDKFRCYPGLGEKGFKTSQTIFKEIDEEKGPAIVFSDKEQCIFLADMSGDGLTDIVRIRNKEICYWPNLGYGYFGGKVIMDNAPLLDYSDSFNPSYLRLADIDGSGTTDLIYLGKNDFRVWMNLNGNEWTQSPQIIQSFPEIHDLSDVSILDFLGSGTACIVYSSPINNQPLQYIDLMQSKKPGLFIGYHNNCGKESYIEYKSSTFFYLEDKKAGNKWITKLPFPVHCISKVRTEDKIRETVFVSSYKYRHGYFDYEEREFRGFARVEQLDTEDFSQFKLNDAKNVVDEVLHQPPVRTVSWFHTGALVRNKKILHQCESEYFKNDLFDEYDIPEPQMPDGLSNEELKEAYRACKGMPLRNEVYGDDNTNKSLFPYTASQSTLEIRLIQPKGENKYACFLIVPSETISYTYDRNPADPRVSQSFVLETDELGNLKKSCSVIHPRVARPTGTDAIVDKVWEEQNKRHISYEESFFTNDIFEEDVYRIRVGYESKEYEINGINLPINFFYTKAFIKTEIAATTEILFEEDFTAIPQKRLCGHSRAYFYKDDLTGSLPLGKLSKLGISYKSNQLVFTKNLVSKYYGTKVINQMLLDAKYVHSEGDDHWWSQQGDVIFPPNPKDKFYIAIGARDIYGNESFVEYDKYLFLIIKSTDAILNSIMAKNDYRTLSTILMTDSNLNRSAVETDELGIVIKSAIMGKAGSTDGDTLEDPTTRMEYNFFNWKNNKKPNYIHAFAREKHGPTNTKWQESYAYFDAEGSIIMSKRQAKPGKAKLWNPTTKSTDEVDADPRWIANGRTICNNKGKPVKQYDPYFSTTFEYESEDALVETGVSPIVYYDAVGRNLKTEFPNGTFVKAEFNAWFSKTYDVNDTIKDSQWYIDRGSPDPLLITEPTNPETRAAWLAAKHHDTPSIVFADSVGGTTYAIMDNGNGRKTSIFTETDSGGRFSKIYDQLDRCVTESYMNISGEAVYTKTAEKGERWVFTDVMGRTVKAWENNLELYSTYDKIHRTVSSFIKDGSNETLFGHVVYGDSFPDADAKAQNLKGQMYQMYDQGGVITIKDIDFKGNASRADRKLTKEYKQNINWKILDGLNNITDIENAAAPCLEDEIFISLAEVDALNRPITTTLPDKTIIEPKYDIGNSLESLKVKIRGKGSFVTFLDSQEYDAKGQRKFVKYGNGTITNYFYDPKNFQLINLITKLSNTVNDSQSIQNLKYTFDPIGNMVQLRDDAQQTHFFKNAVVNPESKYEYDALYQLIKAGGREHAGIGGDNQRNDIDLPVVKQLPHQNNITAVRNYNEEYEYDDCGNIKLLKHTALGANWSTRYKYQYEDDPNNRTNRLKGTNLPGDVSGIFSATYKYDSNGNMTSMPHLSIDDSMKWNFMEQLKEVNLGGGGKAYYSYSMSGDRIRKVIERPGGKKLERIYLGLVEIYRERQNNADPDLERYTLHISDNTAKIAQVDTKTIDKNNQDSFNSLNENVIRYQYTNHLGSASLETDEKANIISYEEYHPYGTSAYRICKSSANFSLKRYRFTGKERDDETGFYYFGARYYAAWLGRWTSSDPGGFVSGFNLYRYCSNSPIIRIDSDGMQDHSGCTFGIPMSDGSMILGWDCRERVPGPVQSPPPPPSPPPPTPTPPRPRSRPRPRATAPAPAAEASPAAPPVEAAAPTPAAPAETTTSPGSIADSNGGALIRNNPQGETLAVPDTIDTAKIARIREGVRQGQVGRNTGPANPTRARRSAQVQVEALREFRLRRPMPSPGMAAGHRIDMQYDLTNRMGNHWRDYIWENGAGNTSDGFAGWNRLRRYPQGVPVGGVARQSQIGRFTNSPGFRTAMRGAGAGFAALGTGLSVYGLYNDIQEGDVPMGIGDTFGIAGGGLELYAFGASSTLFGAAPTATVGSVTVGSVGGMSVAALPLGIALSGVAVGVTSGVSGYRAYQRHDTPGTVAGAVGVVAGTSLAAGGTIALLSAGGVAMAPALVAAAPVLIAVGAVLAIGVGVFHAGRYFNCW
ncbi:SpvB/TcaC N-terminal domain-containing protein [Flavobacterium sp.]|uniref:SpvB/TcaC N-terminal domain-containing protein n=1 Tax=Flavobacterium sp. TaxID=239 RepID=UPI003266F3D5